jgi:hypothetical protein
MKEGERNIYYMAKIQEIKTRNVDQVKCIKDGADELLVKDVDIKHRWREYFDKLFNRETGSSTIELDDSFDEPADVLCGESRSLRSRRLTKG